MRYPSTKRRNHKGTTQLYFHIKVREATLTQGMMVGYTSSEARAATLPAIVGGARVVETIHDRRLDMMTFSLWK